MATDAALGVAGIGVAKSGAKIGVGVYAMKHGGKVRAAGKVDEAADLHRAGRHVYREGIAEGAGTIVVVTGVEQAFSYYERANAITPVGTTAITPLIPVQNRTSLAADLRRARNGRFGKKRCTATYRGKRCIRTWPHPGKHISSHNSLRNDLVTDVADIPVSARFISISGCRHILPPHTHQWLPIAGSLLISISHQSPHRRHCLPLLASI